jgi:hypothetical protein
MKEKNEMITDAPISVKAFVERYDWPSESAMRAYIFKADKLGLAPAFLRFRGRVLVKPKLFFSLIENQIKNA